MCIVTGSKYPAALAGRYVRGAVERTIRQANPPVVPCSRALHEQRVDRVDRQRPYRLQNIGNRWRTWARISVIIGHVWEQAADARTDLLLNEHVTVIAVPADGGEDRRNSLHAEITARRNPRRVV